MPIIRFVASIANVLSPLSHAGRCHMASRDITTQSAESERALLYTVWAGVLAVLFMPLIVTSSTLFPFIVGKALFARSLIEVTAAVWLMLIFAYPRYRPARSWVLAAFGVWVVISLLAGFAGVSLVRSLWSTYERMQGIVDLAHWLAFVVIASTIFRSFNDWKLFFSVNLGVCTLVSVLGIGAHFDLWESNLIGSSTRIQSTLGNPTYVGAYTMVNLMIALGMAFHTWYTRRESEPRSVVRRRRRRASQRPEGASEWQIWLHTFWITSAGVNLWALWLTGTRGAYVGMVACAITFAGIYLMWGAPDVLKKASYAIFGVSAAGIIFFGLARSTTALDPLVDASFTLRRVTQVSLTDASIKGRFTAASAGLRAYRDKPILGWGPENYLIAWGRYFDLDSGVTERFDQAHNKLVEELTTKGTFGLAAYLWVWGAMCWVIVRSVRRREPADRIIIAFVSAALVGSFAQNMFLFDSPVTSLQFAVMVAFVAGEEMWLRRSDPGQEETDTGQDRQPSGFMSFDSTIARSIANRLHTPIGGIVGAVVLAAVVSASLVFFNVRQFTAATAVVQTSDPQISWADRFSFFEESIGDFPGLANYPRLLLMSQVTNNIGTLNVDELNAALELIEREGAEALKAEPESWRIHLSLARFYQLISQVDPSSLETARQHIDEGVRLAPKTLDADATRREQERLEAAR